MKRIFAFVLCMSVLTSGCISTHVVKRKAQSHLEYDAEGRHEVDGRKAYYAILPLTIVADVVTYPIQIFVVSDSSATMSIDGWHVPLK
ncbi:MAG TPA: hypothetical protein VK850_11830 [Candidatus Binatia bacterium]|nr:hypothetical protein [Candidatus Binatia bacterium]